VPSDYLLKLAQAANDLSMGLLAQKFMLSYQEQVQKQKEAGQLDPQSRAIASEAEGDDFDNKILKSEERFALGKSLWLSHGSEASNQIKSNLSRVSEEHPQSYESEIILSLLDDRKGEAKSALGHAIKAQVLLSNPKDDLALRLKHWIAILHKKSGDLKAAASLYEEVEKAVAQSGTDANRKPAQITQATILGIPELPTEKLLLLTRAEIY
jgi:hypothetical protein